MYPLEYILFLVHFHGDRDYFECHEIMEEYWKKVDNKNKRSIWVAFILLAVSCYHHRRGNRIGAQRTLLKAKNLLQQYKKEVEQLGINEIALMSLIAQEEKKLENNQPFISYNLPINDPKLEESCKKLCRKMKLIWKDKEKEVPYKILHRHLTRDRSSVILEREEAIVKRKR